MIASVKSFLRRSAALLQSLSDVLDLGMVADRLFVRKLSDLNKT